MPFDESDDMTPVIGPVGHVLSALFGALLAGGAIYRSVRRWLP